MQTLAGVNLTELSTDEVEALRSVPAMIFYGVPTVQGVLMRTLAVPRSVAVGMGERFKAEDAPGPVSRLRARVHLARGPAFGGVGVE